MAAPKYPERTKKLIVKISHFKEVEPSPFHGTCLDFTSLKWLIWFDSLCSGGLAIYLLFFYYVFFFRERYQNTRFTGVPPIPFNDAASDSNRRECAHCCCWGCFWVHMRAPDCLDPSLKSETNRLVQRLCTKFVCKNSCAQKGPNVPPGDPNRQPTTNTDHSNRVIFNPFSCKIR